MVAVKRLHAPISACGRSEEVAWAPECLWSLYRGCMLPLMPVVAVKRLYALLSACGRSKEVAWAPKCLWSP